MGLPDLISRCMKSWASMIGGDSGTLAERGGEGVKHVRSPSRCTLCRVAIGSPLLHLGVLRTPCNVRLHVVLVSKQLPQGSLRSHLTLSLGEFDVMITVQRYIPSSPCKYRTLGSQYVRWIYTKVKPTTASDVMIAQDGTSSEIINLCPANNGGSNKTGRNDQRMRNSEGD
jgi:hypothetical protein